MVIHKIYCIPFIRLLWLLHYFQYSHYKMCELYGNENCSSRDKFLCQFGTGSEYRSETFNNIIKEIAKLGFYAKLQGHNTIVILSINQQRFSTFFFVSEKMYPPHMSLDYSQEKYILSLLLSLSLSLTHYRTFISDENIKKIAQMFSR